MEDNTNYISNSSSTNTGSSIASGNNNKTFKDTFRQGSPDEVRDKVKGVVAKGVDAVAGALKGFTDEAQKEKLSEKGPEAIRTAGDTVGKTASSVTDQVKSTTTKLTEEMKSLKQPLQETGQKLRETGKDLSQTVKQEYSQTRDSVKSGSSTSSLGSSSLSNTGQGSEMPDIRNTPLGKSDRELQKE